MRRLFLSAVFLCVAAASGCLRAQVSSELNLPTKTAGGEQLWSDELVLGKWRMQRQVIDEHYRLLDPDNMRRAWGTAEECRAAVAELRSNGSIPPVAGRVVITLHGLGRSRDNMQQIGKALEDHGELTWINVGYASMRNSIDEHAQSLAKVIEGLSGADEINFACHSMGNLVVRRYLGEAAQPEPRWKTDSRIKRMVMLGPPNNGARIAQAIAEQLQDNEIARLLAGPASWQLARKWEETAKQLATPSFEFAVIAGGLGDNRGMNPFLEGDDDLIVRVEETRLPGAADFRLVNCSHRQLVNHADVHKFLLAFLESGAFTTADERQPIVEAPRAVTAEGQ